MMSGPARDQVTPMWFPESSSRLRRNQKDAVSMKIREATEGPRSDAGAPGRESSEVRAAGVAHAPLPGLSRDLSHLLDLLASGELLCKERRLDSVEQPFEPSDQLCLRDTQFTIGRDLAILKGKREHVQFFGKIGRQRGRDLGDRPLVDFGEALATGFVELSPPYFLKELAHHRSDPHHLCRFGHSFGGHCIGLGRLDHLSAGDMGGLVVLGHRFSLPR